MIQAHATRSNPNRASRSNGTVRTKDDDEEADVDGLFLLRGFLLSFSSLIFPGSSVSFSDGDYSPLFCLFSLFSIAGTPLQID